MERASSGVFQIGPSRAAAGVLAFLRHYSITRSSIPQTLISIPYFASAAASPSATAGATGAASATCPWRK